MDMFYLINRQLKTLLIFCFSIGLSVNKISAQQEVLTRYIEEVVEDGETSGVDFEQLEERLQEWRDRPLNINTATREELEQIPFLPARMVEEILYYRDRVGQLVTLKELLLVKDMNQPVYKILTEVLTAESVQKKEFTPSLKQIFQQGHHELSTRLDIPFYCREGYKIHSDATLAQNPNKQYLGSAVYNNVRYRFHYGRRVEIGVTAEKDAGEPFFNSINKKGYDFYSPYVIIRNFRKLSVLALGNYRLNYGYGLVMNSGFNMGKAAMMGALGSQSEGITKHSGTNEYRYFQGVAGGIRWSARWQSDLFYSYRTMDAVTDSLWITSLKTDGYHRLPREAEKKNQVANQVIGSNIRYTGRYFHAGFTGVYQVFNKQLIPSLTGYRRFAMHGREFSNVGANYKLFLRRFTLYGETAVDGHGSLATLNALSYSPNSRQRITVMNRFYDVRYQSLYAQAVSEGGSVQGESGIYIGLETNLMKYVRLNSFVDVFYFPWKKYRLSKAGTRGVDGWMQLTYQPRNELEMWIKYRYRNKYRDKTDDTLGTLTLPYIQHKAYYTLQWQPTAVWKLQFKVNCAHVHSQHYPASQGILLSPQASWRPSSLPLQTDVSVAWFCTDDYDTRQYVYEKSVLYAFSSPSFYGRGMRAAWVMRWDVNRHWMVQGKLGYTRYFDRTSIGSDLERIDGNTKTDLNILVRMNY
jgi:hypothetical protein